MSFLCCINLLAAILREKLTRVLRTFLHKIPRKKFPKQLRIASLSSNCRKSIPSSLSTLSSCHFTFLWGCSQSFDNSCCGGVMTSPESGKNCPIGISNCHRKRITLQRTLLSQMGRQNGSNFSCAACHEANVFHVKLTTTFSPWSLDDQRFFHLHFRATRVGLRSSSLSLLSRQGCPDLQEIFVWSGLLALFAACS